jgi:peptidoglycan DL-endopeptidase CwlO
MNDPESPPSRTRRALIALAMTAALVTAGSGAAWASINSSAYTPTGGGSPETEASLQAQAQELAGQIQSDGRTLDELANAYGAAQLRYQQLSVQLTAEQKAVAGTDAMVVKTKQDLKQQALLAYLAGGAPLLTYVPEKPGQDPSMTASYAEIIAGGQQRAVKVYRATLALQTRQQRQLAASQLQAAATLSAIRSDQSAAQATLASEQQSLSQVKGQLAVLVAQVEAAQQKAEEAQVRSQLASQNDLPPASAPSAASRSRGGPTLTAKPIATVSRSNGVSAKPPAHPAAALSAPASPAITSPPTTSPPATSAPRTSPRITSPPRTSPRITSPPRTSPPKTAPPRTAPPRTVAPAPPPPRPAPPTTSPPAPISSSPASGAWAAIAYARAQLGKPYQWGGTGPNSFDCSGLVMMAWRSAGVYLPRVAQDQYYATRHIPLSAVMPGDLIFFGTPSNVYHVGMYIGGGEMIDAPETGQVVSIQSIYWSSLLGAGRV